PGPAAVLGATTYDQRDIAGRLSARLDAPVLTNAVGLEGDGEGGPVVVETAVFGGELAVRARVTSGGCQLILARPRSFAPAEVGGAPAAVVPLDGGGGVLEGAVVVERHLGARTGPGLDEASVVVAGGRGLGEPANFALIEELASLLGGAPAATRAIVDAGWVPYAYQVGQTGTTVKPALYIACGVSGATQHLVGMKGARTIVAINRDACAPIFGVADLGVVGDVREVLPRLIAALRARAGPG
ncbi:MAG: electron transfer flavoprotein subunit alpha/FixB family protein, partial [Acidimicrobiales bacterium]